MVLFHGVDTVTEGACTYDEPDREGYGVSLVRAAQSCNQKYHPGKQKERKVINNLGGFASTSAHPACITGLL